MRIVLDDDMCAYVCSQNLNFFAVISILHILQIVI
jgi:hypothetical protein